MAYIDAHVHVWTDDTQKYPPADPAVRGQIRPPSFTPEELLGHCRPSGVERIVLVQVGHYRYDNSYMLDTMRRFPGTFAGIAKVDWQAWAPDEAMLQLAKEGVRGFRITRPNPRFRQWVEHEGFRKMFAAGADHNLAICLLADPDALPAFAKMCRWFRRTPVVIDHIGRIGAAGPAREEDVEALCRMAKYPAVKVKLSAFYALGAKAPPHDDLAPLIRRVYEAFGPERLIWGSDCPFAVMNETYEDSLSLVRDRLDFLTAEDKAWILEKTAEATFFGN